MLRTSSYFKRLVLLGALTPIAPRPLRAQPSPPDTVRGIAALHAALVGAGPRIGPRIWPGFRPDTIPSLYVIPHRGKLFAQLRDTLSTGFFPLEVAAGDSWTDSRSV